MFGERYVETEASELVFDGSDPIGAYFSQEIIDAVAASGATTLEDAGRARGSRAARGGHRNRY